MRSTTACSFRLLLAMCDVFLGGSRRGPTEKEQVRQIRASVSEALGDFKVTRSSTSASYSAPRRLAGRHRCRSGASARASSCAWAPRRLLQLTSAGSARSRCSAMSVRCCRPRGVVEAGRHIVAHLLHTHTHTPGSSWPQRGHPELAEGWGWPDVGLVEASLAVEPRCRAECTPDVCQMKIGILTGTQQHRPNF